LWLFIISRGWMEKVYFGFCTISATSGLLRTAAGDQTFHAGLYVRVVMLVNAVLIGVLIVRRHSRELARTSTTDNGRNDQPQSFQQLTEI
jgi:hypothetical protein